MTDEWLGVHPRRAPPGHVDDGHDDVRPRRDLAERVEHLRRVRELQDESRGFRAFISWTFQPDNTGSAPARHADAGAFEYLRTQAVSRLYLDNVDNIQSSWVTQGLKIGQVALFFGANDMGSMMIEENVVSAAGTTYRAGDRRLLPRHPRAASGPCSATRCTGRVRDDF